MEYVRFGSTGMKVSKLCLGCMTYGSKDWRDWVLNEEESLPFIRKALDMGINFFDTADMYSNGASEEILGKAINKYSSRDDVVLATKVFNPMSDRPNDKGLSRKHILKSIDASLKRLGTDYVDLYIIHRFDPETPIEETIEALDTVVRSGKARYIGASSMHSWQFMRMLSLQEQNGLAKFVSMQNHYNLIYREEEREMLPLCREMGIAVTPWSPLARGLLAGSRKNKTLRATTDPAAHLWYDEHEQEDLIIDAVIKTAENRGVPPAQVAMAWLTRRQGITSPIIGATKPHHLDDAMAGLTLELTAEEISVLEMHYRARPVAGHE